MAADPDDLGVVSMHLLSTNLRRHLRHFTPAVRAQYLAELARTGSSQEAARATGVRLNYLRLHMKHDAALARQVEEACRCFEPKQEQQP